MCGIIGYIGKKKRAIEVLLFGLKSLEYRGYDSAGIAINNNNEIKIIKCPGKIKDLSERTNNLLPSNIGIGHTRWATHGAPCERNAHPHKVGMVTLVHNGIIENYATLKEELIKEGYIFNSDTDSEVACALIDKYYKLTKDKLKTIKKVINTIRGSYAFGIIFDDDLETIYAIRKDSPLIIAINDEENYIASDVPAILNETNKYILLNDNEVAVIKSNDIKIYDENLNIIKKDINIFSNTLESAKKNGFDHYMLKEIYDEPSIINSFINTHLLPDYSKLLNKLPDISKYHKIEIIGCGSAYHAGLVGAYFLEEYANIKTNVYLASEYRYSKHFFDKSTLTIFISQSGETADTLAALRLVKKENIHTLALINVVSSSIAREADDVIYLNAGYEIAVATTKAYSMQVLILSLLALSVSIHNNNLSTEELTKLTEEYRSLPNKINALLKKRKIYKNIALSIYKKDNLFFIGRSIDATLCMEASLKLKEISYIHSESYYAGELKHGTISLIEEGTPVIAIITDNALAEKTISNIKETLARGANAIIITTTSINQKYHLKELSSNIIVLPSSNFLIEPLIVAPVFQLLSYEVALLRGLDIDQPRNLAKSVTVE